MKIRKLIRESLLKQILLEVSRKDIQNQVEIQLYDQFASRFDSAKTTEEFDAVEQEFLAAVNQAVEEEMIRQGGSVSASQTKTKIKDEPKWSDLDDLQNTQLVPIDNNSLETFYDDGSQDVIDVTDGDNPQFMMNRRDFLKNSALGTAAAAYGLNKLYSLSSDENLNTTGDEYLDDIANDIDIDIDTRYANMTSDEILQIGSHIENILSGMNNVTPKELALIGTVIVSNYIDKKLSYINSGKIKIQEDISIDEIEEYWTRVYETTPGYMIVTFLETFFKEGYRYWGQADDKIKLIFSTPEIDKRVGKITNRSEVEEVWEVYDELSNNPSFLDQTFIINKEYLGSFSALFQDRFEGGAHFYGANVFQNNSQEDGINIWPNQDSGPDLRKKLLDRIPDPAPKIIDVK